MTSTNPPVFPLYEWAAYSAMDESQDQLDPRVLRSLSYQALTQAFIRLLSGSIYWRTMSYPVMETMLDQTALWALPELRFLRDYGIHRNGSFTMDKFTAQGLYRRANDSVFHGLSSEPPFASNGSLAETIEKLFEKIVVSTLASEHFQPDYASQYAPALTNVTFHTYHNIYTYSADKLWIAYGVAICAAVVASLLGLFVMLVETSSYSMQFSSIFLFARDVEIDYPDGLGSAEIAKEAVSVNLGKTRVCSGVNRVLE